MKPQNMIYPLRKLWTVMTISLKASLRNLRKIDNILIAAEKSICGDAAGLYRKENRSNPELQIIFWSMKLEATYTTNKLARMRTINEALALIRKQDPETAVTYNFIRKLLDGDRVRHFRSGSRYILNFDDLLNELNMN